MLKRVLLGALLVGVIGILVAGAIIRTVDKTENVAEARGEGRGRGSIETDVYSLGQTGGGGFGQGGRYGQAANTAERQYPNYETVPEDWAVYNGTVAETPETGGELVIVTEDGQELSVGTGPGYMDAQGFALQTSEQVQVQGYWEGEEFKAAQVTRLGDGETITLRDQLGRPAWAGAGKRSAEQQAATSESAPGQGGYGGEGRTDAPGDATGTGQAQVDEWITLSGTVVSLDADALVVQTAVGEQVVMENRPWRYAQEQGFVATAGDQVRVVGFYEDGEFEVGQIDNLSTGLSVQIREEGGRPMWAGRGQRGG